MVALLGLCVSFAMWQATPQTFQERCSGRMFPVGVVWGGRGREKITLSTKLPCLAIKLTPDNNFGYFFDFLNDDKNSRKLYNFYSSLR